jgi:hypothetical protein
MPLLRLPEFSLNLNLSRRRASDKRNDEWPHPAPLSKARTRIKGASDIESAISALYDFVLQEALDETNPRADYRVTSLEPR